MTTRHLPSGCVSADYRDSRSDPALAECVRHGAKLSCPERGAPCQRRTQRLLAMDDLNEEHRLSTGDDFGPGPWHASDLLRELHALRAVSSPQQRGYKLESLLERAFRKAHFQAEHNPAMVRPRQTDFAVIAHNYRYLVEVKWENHPAGTETVDAVRNRLRRGDGTVVGVLFTMLGMNDTAIEQIVGRRDDGLVLVFDEADVLVALEDPLELERLLRVKHDDLVVHGRVHLGAQHREARRSARDHTGRKPQPLPAAHYRLVNLDGDEVPWFHGEGGFDATVFCLDLPDVDWVPAAGSGVCLDMTVAAWGQPELLRLFDELNGLGWVSDQGHWSIQQHGRNWHGTGARSFVQALKGWKARTSELEDPHHSEEFVYFEACDGGFYTVSGNISAERTRRVVRCNVSFQLVGVPLEPGSLQQLYRRFDVPSRGYFRPLVERSVTRRRLDSRVPLRVLGYIVEPAGQRWDQEDWVVGVLATNPYYENDLQPPDDWPSDLGRSGVIVCDLASHHQLTNPKERYELWSYERARTSDARALRVVAEWREAADEGRVQPDRPPATEGRYFTVNVLDGAAEDPPPARVTRSSSPPGDQD